MRAKVVRLINRETPRQLENLESPALRVAAYRRVRRRLKKEWNRANQNYRGALRRWMSRGEGKNS